MNDILNILNNKILTYEQKVSSLARVAENSISPLNIPEKTQTYRENGIICDLFEGNAPYRSRYIVPDYDKFIREGSTFLTLSPPTDIWEAINNLLILYKHVPSITGFPVYIGNIDKLLEPFVEDEQVAYKAIKLFLTHIDRTITDSFCHANIGPEKTKAGSLILKAERELENSVPNLTMKCSDTTPDSFIIEGIETSLEIAKPSFAKHETFSSDLGEDYAIASCYNGLPTGGGSYTLVRLNLAGLVKKCSGLTDFLELVLPEAVEMTCQYIEERISFIINKTSFFESNFLLKEGLLQKEKFTAMFGVVGLAECVNYLFALDNQKDRFGCSEEAKKVGENIIKRLEQCVNSFLSKYCNSSQNRFLLHAQVGLSLDKGVTPGCRIPIGNEPDLNSQIMAEAPFHKYFPAGIGNVYLFDKTIKNNPEAVLDIIKGSFKLGMRYFSAHCSDADVIRITGYLVKRSEIVKLKSGKQVLKDTVELGKDAVENLKVLNRKIRSNG